MNNYTVTMKSGHEYFVSADSAEEAAQEAIRLAASVHGVIDSVAFVN